MKQEKFAQKLSALYEEFPEFKDKVISCEEGKVQIVQKTNIQEAKIELQEVIAGPSPKIEIRKSPVHGYGIFAKEFIPKDHLIEEGRLLKLALRTEICNDWVLKDYLFSQEDVDNAAYHLYGSSRYLGLGYLSLYNHQDVPNTEIKLDFNLELARVKSKRDIEAGEEIFISYGKRFFKYRKLFNNLSNEVKRKISQMDALDKK